MAECQSRSVQRLTGSGAAEEIGSASLGAGDSSTSSSTIDRIAHHRMSHMLQMHSDLVGSACWHVEPQQIDHIKAGNHYSVGPGCPAAGQDGHALSILGVPS